MEDVGEGWEGAGAEFPSFVVVSMVKNFEKYYIPNPRRAPTFPFTCSAHR